MKTLQQLQQLQQQPQTGTCQKSGYETGILPAMKNLLKKHFLSLIIAWMLTSMHGTIGLCMGHGQQQLDQ